MIKNSGSNDYLNASNIMKDTMKKTLKEDLTKCLSKINCSTLIIWGSNDLETPLKDGIIMKKKIKNASLVTIDKATHFVYLEESQKVNNLINEFVGDKG